MLITGDMTSSYDFIAGGSDEVLIKVCTTNHITLVFPNNVIDVFEDGGILYTRQERTDYEHKVEMIDYYADGSFDSINEHHAYILEMESRYQKLKDEIDIILSDSYCGYDIEYTESQTDEMMMNGIDLQYCEMRDDSEDDCYEETQLEYTQLI
jgi:hypothetical protein